MPQFAGIECPSSNAPDDQSLRYYDYAVDSASSWARRMMALQVRTVVFDIAQVELTEQVHRGPEHVVSEALEKGSALFGLGERRRPRR